MYHTIFRYNLKRELAQLNSDRARLRAQLHLEKSGRTRRFFLKLRISWIEQKITHLEGLRK